MDAVSAMRDTKPKSEGVQYHKRIIIRERYNTTYSSYDALYREEQWEKYDKGIQVLNDSGIQLGGIILDDGCGTGLFAEYLKSRGIDNNIEYYVCLDLSENMLGVARKRVKDCEIDHVVELIVADAQSLPLRTNSVDFTFSFTVYTLLDNPREGIAEASRVTRRIVLYTLLKIVPRLHDYNCGRFAGETSKDQIFIITRVREGAVTASKSRRSSL